MVNKVLKRVWKFMVLPLLMLAALWSLYFLVYGNFHKVDNNLYRSAQLFSFNMPHYLETYHIRSVLNLRGAHKNEEWYRDEIAISKEYGVKHYDYGIGDRKVATLAQMHKILQVIKDAPKPLLIHCKAGADRTSLAAALYLYDKNQTEKAKEEISILYGHFPWLGSRTKAMDISFEHYINQKEK